MDSQIVAIVGALGAFIAVTGPIAVNWSKHRLDVREMERRSLVESFTLTIGNLKDEIVRLRAEFSAERATWLSKDGEKDELIERMKIRLDEKDELIAKLVGQATNLVEQKETHE